MDDPRTKSGNDSYPAPGGVGNESSSSSAKAPESAPATPLAGGPRSTPLEQGKPVPAGPKPVPDVPKPDAPDTAHPTQEEPAGSNHTVVPQQVPKPKEGQ